MKYPLCDEIGCLEPSPYRTHEYLIIGTPYIISKDWRKSVSPTIGFKFYKRIHDSLWEPFEFEDFFDELPENAREEFSYHLERFACIK